MRASSALEPISALETEKVLATLCEWFWIRIESRLVHRARLTRIELAKQGKYQPPVIQSGTRTCKALTTFQELAGQLMCQARTNEPGRFSDKTWVQICSKLDAAGYKPVKYLEGKARTRLADWNQKHPNRSLRTFTEGVKPPLAAIFVRRGIQRTLYRAQKKWEKSRANLVRRDIADNNLRSLSNNSK